MRRLAAAAALCAALAGCDLLTGDFRLSGSVDVSPALRDKAPKAGTTLFIVAKNAGGVPVAVHRIVNPEFPAAFTMGPEDLLVPAVRSQEPLTVHAELNTHGGVGRPKPGDLESRARVPARPGEGGVRLLLDRAR